MTVELYDTTLRDGTQAEDISFTVEDKLRVAEKLDELGIRYIEGGWPGSNPKDDEFFQRARKGARKGGLSLKTAKLAAFGSTRHHGNKASKDKNLLALVRAATPAVTIFGNPGISTSKTRSTSLFKKTWI
jgi:2-isopropylmalate synthase